jgi:hypothetical protein
VHIIPHSHCDPGWLTTFEGYYDGQVKGILTNVFNELNNDPTKTFVWAEMLVDLSTIFFYVFFHSEFTGLHFSLFFFFFHLQFLFQFVVEPTKRRNKGEVYSTCERRKIGVCWGWLGSK